ncbi:hypothetical protein PFISCL1PPCAC_19578, partial [Pristionchus fissidentatus]
IQSMFGTQTSAFGATKPLFGATTAAPVATGPAEDVPVCNPPDDTISALKWSPTGNPPLLAAGSWDGIVRVWAINDKGESEGKAQQQIPAPVMAMDWFDDGSKLFIAAADKLARVWDLASNTVAVCGTHDGPVSTCNWVKGTNYSCLMTGSFDKTLRFWDMRQLPTQSAMAQLQVAERIYSADVVFPMACVALANKGIVIYNLENGPQEVKQIESPLKSQSRCISIFKDKNNGLPCGFALGSIEGRVAIQLIEAPNPKDNFTFKCHRSAELVGGYQEIYGVNDIGFHPSYGTLVTIGSDGRYSMWDKDARTKLKTSDQHPLSLTKVSFHSSGMMMAYAVGYDWSRGHEGNVSPGSKIYLHKCDEDMRPKAKK